MRRKSEAKRAKASEGAVRAEIRPVLPGSRTWSRLRSRVPFLGRREGNWEKEMPEKTTMKRAAEHRRKGHKASTQAGAFVREEMHHKRRGKHAVKSSKQAIAIGLSKARRAGVRAPRKRGRTGRRNR